MGAYFASAATALERRMRKVPLSQQSETLPTTLLLLHEIRSSSSKLARSEVMERCEDDVIMLVVVLFVYLIF